MEDVGNSPIPVTQGIFPDISSAFFVAISCQCSCFKWWPNDGILWLYQM